MSSAVMSNLGTVDVHLVPMSGTSIWCPSCAKCGAVAMTWLYPSADTEYIVCQVCRLILGLHEEVNLGAS